MRFLRGASFGVLLLSGCASTTQPNVFLETPAEVRDVVTAPSDLGGTMRFKPELCREEPLASDFTPLTEQSIVDFLKAHKFEVRASRARSDLVFVDVVKSGLSLIHI